MSAQREPSPLPNDEPAPLPRMGPVAIAAYRLLGLFALALGVAGAFLPLLPTTVFLIIAAWAFGKSAPKLRARLYAHKRFGPTLQAWDQRGAIPPRAKAAAVIGMGISLVVLMLTASSPWIPIGAGVALTLCALYVLSRPSA